jgi:hypothetical protein
LIVQTFLRLAVVAPATFYQFHVLGPVNLKFHVKQLINTKMQVVLRGLHGG